MHIYTLYTYRRAHAEVDTHLTPQHSSTRENFVFVTNLGNAIQHRVRQRVQRVTGSNLDSGLGFRIQGLGFRVGLLLPTWTVGGNRRVNSLTHSLTHSLAWDMG